MVLPVHTVKAYGGMESIAAYIFGTRWNESADFPHGGKHFQYPLNRRLGGPQCQSGHFREEIVLLPLPGIKP